MGRAKQARRTLTVDLPDSESDRVSDPEEAEAKEQEQTAASELPARAEAMIFRLDPRTQKFGFLDKLQVPEVSTELMRDNYGGGKYEVVFRRPVDGKVRITRRQVLTVDPSIPPKAPPSVRMEIEQARPTNGAQPTQQGNTQDIIAAGILQLFESQRAQQTMQMQLFEKALQPREPVPWDKILAGAMTLGTSVLVPIFTRKTEPQRDPIEAARQIAELAQKNTSAASSVKDMLSGVKEILEIRSLMGDQPPEDPMMRLAERLGPPVLEILAGARNQQVQPRPALPPPAPAAAPAAPTPPPVPPPPAQPIWRLAVMREMPNLLRAASADKDPGLFGAFIAENMPEQFRGQAKQIAAHPEFIPVTLAQFPEMQQFPDWFAECLGAFRDQILDVQQEDADAGEESQPSG